MKQTFITTLPDESGAFLSASRIVASYGGNITRVSYNKSIDTHLLFIDVDASPDNLRNIADKLVEIGYLLEDAGASQVMLLEFTLEDVPGSVVPVLELICSYDFNISYISSQENGTAYQHFKMGIHVDDPDAVKRFLDEACDVCEVRVIDYSLSEKNLDSTVFYIGFANQIAQTAGLDHEEATELIAQSNLVMQIHDERDEPPYKTFEYIGKFADELFSYKGAAFDARVTMRTLKEGILLYIIEPPCGSTIYIYELVDRLVFIDCGFACYREEMIALLESMFDNFSHRTKDLVITHPDIDHCGLVDLFDTVYASPRAKEHFEREVAGQPCFRELNPVHAPYYRISRLLTSYHPPDPATIVSVGGDALSARIDFPGLSFDIVEGNGGHAEGEIVIVDEANHLVFCGDIMINPDGLTEAQTRFNSLAPYLMLSVNMDSAMATKERTELKRRFPQSEYTYCCGHGGVIDAP